jgi:hypothetical protein
VWCGASQTTPKTHTHRQHYKTLEKSSPAKKNTDSLHSPLSISCSYNKRRLYSKFLRRGIVCKLALAHTTSIKANKRQRNYFTFKTGTTERGVVCCSIQKKSSITHHKKAKPGLLQAIAKISTKSIMAFSWKTTITCIVLVNALREAVCQNSDIFNYNLQDIVENGVNSRGQEHWDEVQCGNTDICVSTCSS